MRDAMAYVKLFHSILASTIWREPPATKVLWITLLALADRDGLVEASVPGLADLARITDDDCRQALAALTGPDPDSRTKANEGRRLREVDGGWLVLNYEFYRDKQSADDTREKNRLRQERKRERDKSRSSHPSRVVTTSGSSDLISDRRIGGGGSSEGPLEGQPPVEMATSTRPETVRENPEGKALVADLVNRLSTQQTREQRAKE